MKALTENAKQLIKIITEEHGMQSARARAGHIREDQVLPCLYERLHRLAVSNGHLKKFLDDTGFVPHREDEGMEFEWAEDPRAPEMRLTGT